MTTPSDFLRNQVKEKLARDELVASMIIRLVRSVEIASIARTAGFDSVYIDLEHSSISLDTAGQICLACLPLNVTPLIRVPAAEPAYIARVLDCGALGIIAPHIESAHQAEAIVRAVKFSPSGARPYAGASPALQFRSFTTTETYRLLNEASMVVVMIESRDAVAKVDEIAAVPGVDILLIGTNDLCDALGIPGQLDHPSIKDAYSRTLDACRKHNKHLGIAGLSSKPALVEEFIRLGARYVSVGSDVAFLMGGATSRVTQLKSTMIAV
jgi:2-keto-3-deoxy-L-rhamnonate aldolase RhmA